jgi:adenosylcobinamide-phosphate synthase
VVTRAGIHPIAAAVGLLADRALGEPPGPHPLALFGRTMGRLERRHYSPSRRAGAAHAATGLGIGLAAGVVAPTAAATWLATGGRALHDAALAVSHALDETDLERARRLMPSLVGRDPSRLDASGISRATIESVAENTVDAIVAPALWAAVAGGPGVLAHRAIDTLDSMVGYPTDRYREFGWASARLDDAAAWVPARLASVLVIAVRPQRARSIVNAIRRDAPAHPSPNAGLIEAAFAGALDLTLGGPTPYPDRVEDRPTLGRGREPVPADIGRAVELSRELTTALAALLAGYGIARALTGRRSRR